MNDERRQAGRYSVKSERGEVMPAQAERCLFGSGQRMSVWFDRHHGSAMVPIASDGNTRKANARRTMNTANLTITDWTDRKE